MDPLLATASLQPGGILPNVAVSKSMILPADPINAKEIANKSGFISPVKGDKSILSQSGDPSEAGWDAFVSHGTACLLE
jgi:hypothetical protein